MTTLKILRLILNRGQFPLSKNINFLGGFLIFFRGESNKMAENKAFQQQLKFEILNRYI